MVILLMGVSGSGKTTIGEMLAESLGWPYHDADAFHPPENVEKMGQGHALTDADRAPWLRAIRCCVQEAVKAGESAVISCSALKQAYRDFLFRGFGDGQKSASARCEVCLVYLEGSEALIRERVTGRKGHFAKESLVESQFAALEEPTGAVTVSVDQPPERVVEAIKEAFGLGSGKEEPRSRGAEE